MSFDLGLFLTMVACGVAGVMSYLLLRGVVALIYAVAQTVSYVRWSMNNMTPEMKTEWETYSPWKKIKTMVQYGWEEFPEVAISSYESGENYWNGIFDHKP